MKLPSFQSIDRELALGMAQDIQRSEDLIEQSGLRLMDFLTQYKTRMEQVLINLVRNAVEAFPAGRKGRIEIVAASGPEDTVLIQMVSDSGSGIRIDISLPGKE